MSEDLEAKVGAAAEHLGRAMRESQRAYERFITARDDHQRYDSIAAEAREAFDYAVEELLSSKINQ